MTLLGALVVLLHLHRRNLDFFTYIHIYIHTYNKYNCNRGYTAAVFIDFQTAYDVMAQRLTT